MNINSIREELEEADNNLLSELLKDHVPQELRPGDVTSRMLSEAGHMSRRGASEILSVKYNDGTLDRYLVLENGRRVFAYHKKVV
jgi:hypothetical protein